MAQDIATMLEHVQKLTAPSIPEPISEGVSLLSAKALVLSTYTQYITMLTLKNLAGDESVNDAAIQDQLTKLRVFYEKGCLNLENKLKYPIEKALKAFHLAQKDSSENQEDDDLQHKANLMDSVNTSDEDQDDSMSSDDDDNDNSSRPFDKRRRLHQNSKSLYQPPKPFNVPTSSKDTKTKRNDPTKYIMQSYLDEMSDKPMAEVSVGTNIERHGRSFANISSKERREQAERENYEEANYVRLPTLSKKQKAKLKVGKNEDIGFGGEDWRMLRDYSDVKEKSKKSSKFSKPRSGPVSTELSAHEIFENKKRQFGKKVRKRENSKKKF